MSHLISCLYVCKTRNSFLITIIILSIIASIIGFILSRHLATNTKSYKAFKSELPFINNTNWEKNSYNIIKNIEGFEYHFEKMLFIFPIIFLVFAIFFMIFSGGEDQYKVLPTIIYKIYNVTKIICIVLSSICITLSSLYFAILLVALKQYEKFVKEADECNLNLTLGIIFGFLGIIYYLHLVVLFVLERNEMIKIGTVENPGPKAKYDRNGNIIQKNVLPIIIENIPGQPQIISEIGNIEAPEGKNQNIIVHQSQQNQQSTTVDFGTKRTIKNN